MEIAAESAEAAEHYVHQCCSLRLLLTIKVDPRASSHLMLRQTQ